MLRLQAQKTDSIEQSDEEYYIDEDNIQDLQEELDDLLREKDGEEEDSAQEDTERALKNAIQENIKYLDTIGEYNRKSVENIIALERKQLLQESRTYTEEHDKCNESFDATTKFNNVIFGNNKISVSTIEKAAEEFKNGSQKSINEYKDLVEKEEKTLEEKGLKVSDEQKSDNNKKPTDKSAKNI